MATSVRTRISTTLTDATENLAHSASFHSLENNAPSNPGTKQLDEAERRVGHRDRVPALRCRRQLGIACRRRTSQRRGDLPERASMRRGGPDAIKPASLVGGPRRGGRRAGDLLGIQPIGAALRGVSPHWQRAWQRLRLETVAEAGHVAGMQAGPSRRVHHGQSASTRRPPRAPEQQAIMRDPSDRPAVLSTALR